MLVLKRKVNESIMIGEETEIVVVKVAGDWVKLGIKAPLLIPVHRKEVYLRIRDKAKEAAA